MMEYEDDTLKLFHIAKDVADLVSACRNHIRSDLKARHIDGWIALPIHTSGLDACSAAERLYFADLGQNRAGSFYEQHDYALIIASDSRTAIRQAKAGHPGWHVDNLIDLTREADLRGHALHARTARNGAKVVSKYIRL
jgi:hypothetical protein